MVKQIELECGCRFKVDDDGHMIYDPRFDAKDQYINLDCPKVWDLFCTGNTKGVFQLESNLGRSKSKEIQPRNIRELSDLIAIIRPGSSEALMEDGKSVTWHYIQRKSGKEEVTYFHPALESSLKSTYGLLVYQEQALNIAKEIGGFTMEEAEVLRKAIGKKKADIMAEMKKLFITKAEAHGVVNKEEAEEIFSWIEASQRYSFNLSHSVSYAYNSFLSAHAKAHFPKEFFAAYLKHADGKIDHYVEIKELIDNAKTMDINVHGPDIRFLNERFEIINGDIYYGLVDIKSVGTNDFNIIKEKIQKNRNSLQSFDQFVFNVAVYLSKDTTIALIESGALDCFNLTRNYMSYVYKLFLELGKREIAYILENFTDSSTIIQMIQHIIRISKELPAKQRPIYNVSKISTVESILDNIKHPTYNIEDSIMWIATQEQKYLGYEITCSKIDIYNSVTPSCTCKDFLNGYGGERTLSLVVEIKAAREYAIKNGKNKGNMMLFLTIADSSCTMDNATVFTDQYIEYKDILYKGNVVHLIGKRDKKKGGFIVEKVKELI